jgi:hypothetical protein
MIRHRRVSVSQSVQGGADFGRCLNAGQGSKVWHDLHEFSFGDV